MEYFFIKMKYPISLAVRGTRYESKKKNNELERVFLGGLIGFDSKVFVKINGYPNNFWGWGGEDDSLIIRLLKCGINSVNYPKKGSIIDIEEEKLKRIG
jgi:predicted glycosyltransferase involved in capsule biosynthesis